MAFFVLNYEKLKKMDGNLLISVPLAFIFLFLSILFVLFS